MMLLKSRRKRESANNRYLINTDNSRETAQHKYDISATSKTVHDDLL